MSFTDVEIHPDIKKQFWDPQQWPKHVLVRYTWLAYWNLHVLTVIFLVTGFVLLPLLFFFFGAVSIIYVFPKVPDFAVMIWEFYVDVVWRNAICLYLCIYEFLSCSPSLDFKLKVCIKCPIYCTLVLVFTGHFQCVGISHEPHQLWDNLAELFRADSFG